MHVESRTDPFHDPVDCRPPSVLSQKFGVHDVEIINQQACDRYAKMNVALAVISCYLVASSREQG